MDQPTLQSIGTVLAFVAFIGVCWWAYVAHKKSDFDEQANLPFADDSLAENQQKDRDDEKSV